MCICAQNILFSSVFLIATTVCGVSVWRDPSGSPSLWCVWGGLCWLLSGQRPILRLGWQILLQILILAEEVRIKLIYTGHVWSSFPPCVCEKTVVSEAAHTFYFNLFCLKTLGGADGRMWSTATQSASAEVITPIVSTHTVQYSALFWYISYIHPRVNSIHLVHIYCSFCFIANKNTLETVQYGVEGSTTFLECQARSPHMSLKWHLQKENSDRRKEVSNLLYF